MLQALIIFAAVLAACCVLFFATPHRRPVEYLNKPLTLAGLYAEFFDQVPERRTTVMRVMLLLGALGVAASFYPAAIVLIVALVRPVGGGAWAGWLVACGALAAVGAAANLLAMLLAHVSFMWGASSSTKDMRFGVWLIPAVQTASALASVVIGVSDPCARWAAWAVGL